MYAIHVHESCMHKNNIIIIIVVRILHSSAFFFMICKNFISYNSKPGWEIVSVMTWRIYYGGIEFHFYSYYQVYSTLTVEWISLDYDNSILRRYSNTERKSHGRELRD